MALVCLKVILVTVVCISVMYECLDVQGEVKVSWKILDLCTLKSNLCQVILEVVSEDGAKSKCCFEGMYPLEVELGLGLGRIIILV